MFRSVSQRITELARLQPDSIAIEDSDQQITYAELDQRASAAAKYLADNTDCSGSVVAICMERSCEWIISALAIMRAGAAYLPIDTKWPASRICLVLKEASVAAVVGSSACLEIVGEDIFKLEWSAFLEAGTNSRSSNHGTIEPENLAYVIYTSGSSGIPKGVEITNDNLSDLVDWHCDAFGVTCRDRTSHLAGLGFDAAAWEIWPNLCAGATVCLARNLVRTSPEEIKKWLIENRISIAFVPTVHALPMMFLDWEQKADLRILLTGGETLLKSPPKGLPFVVINNYGPTECTVVATSAVLEPGADGAPTIGMPRKGALVYILDPSGKPVPDGSCGEVYIGGPCVGRGYRNSDLSSAQQFLRDPFVSRAGDRMFRTGDRALREPDGQLRFIGRSDRQVKLYGQRVELGEIEAVLSKHPGIRFTSVQVKKSTTGRSHLVAYIQSNPESTAPIPRELRQLLGELLPHYMIPDSFVFIKEPPVSLNGKSALNVPLPIDEFGSRSIVVKENSLTPTEAELLEAIRGLLPTSQIELQDNFFLAGGDSLLGVQLVVMLRDRFRIEISFEQLFEASTVQKLAQFIHVRRTNADKPGTAIRSVSVDTAQNADSTIMQEEPAQFNQATDIYWLNQTSIALSRALFNKHKLIPIALSHEDSMALGSSITMSGIASMCANRILARHRHGPIYLGGFCSGGILAYETSVQLQNAGKEVSLVIMVDSPGPGSFGNIHLFGPTVSSPAYLAKRFAKIGARNAALKVCKRLFDRIGRLRRMSPVGEGKDRQIDEVMRSALQSYEPPAYYGQILLLLASDHAPHVNLMQEWKWLVNENFRTQYVPGHHDELMEAAHAQPVADAICSMLESLEKTTVKERYAPGFNSTICYAGRSRMPWEKGRNSPMCRDDENAECGLTCEPSELENPESGRALSLMQMLIPENFANPHVLYRKLREHDPVHWDDYLHAWVVTSYREAVTVLTEYSADRTPKASRLEEVGLSSLKPFSEMMMQQMMFLDGTKHSRLRAICSAAFTPNRVNALKGHIEDIANTLLDKVCKKGTMDLVAGFAAPLPAIVTAELLGVPSADHEQLHAWVLDIAEVFGNYQPNPRRVSEIMRSLEDLRLYLGKQMESQRRHPSNGLIYSLMAAEVDGHHLSDEEVLANAIITLIGGHETTTNLVAGGFLTLLRNPESLEELRRNPEITSSSVEELLRYESPVQHTARIAPKGAQLCGKLIREGSRVVVVLAAANRDPARFQDPDRLDLRRADNRHLAFGWASHFCFGAPLARIEAQIAFSTLLRRLSNPRLAKQELEWRENAGLRSLRALRISFDSCAA